MRGTEVSEFIDLAYTWQERAIKAEAEVERLKAENAKLRAVVDAARVLSDIWSVGGKPNLSNLRYALAELEG